MKLGALFSPEGDRFGGNIDADFPDLDHAELQWGALPWGSQPFPKADRSGYLVTLASGVDDDDHAALPIRVRARVL